MKDLRNEARDLKECVADLTLERREGPLLIGPLLGRVDKFLTVTAGGQKRQFKE